MWKDWVLYLPMWLVGVGAAFGSKQIQNRALLVQMPVFFRGLFFTALYPLFKINEQVFHFTTMVIYGLFFYIWYVYASRIVSAWRMLEALFVGVIYMSVVVWCYFWVKNSYLDWRHIVYSESLSYSLDMAYMIGLLLIAVWCEYKSAIIKRGMPVAFLLYALFGVNVIVTAIPNKIIYGTFTGKVNKPAPLALISMDGKRLETEEVFKNNHVCLVWQVCNNYTTRDFDTLFKKYRGKMLDFSIIGIVRPPEYSMDYMIKRYAAMHLECPLYFITEEEWRESPMKTYDEWDYYCIFRQDTLVYMGGIWASGEKWDEVVNEMTK